MAKTARTNRTPKKAVTRTGDWKPVFLAKLAKYGIVSKAAKIANVGHVTVYEHRRNDPAFAKAWRRSLRQAVEVMEAEAWRRAVKGTTKPVYQQGDRVGAVQEYSDTLLIFLLKGAKPKRYRDNVKLEHTGKNGGAIKVAADVTHAVDYDAIEHELDAIRMARRVPSDN